MLPDLAARGWRIEDVAAPEAGVWITPGADTPVDYPPNAHGLLEEIETKSAWYRERNRIVLSALAADGLPARFLDVGAGNGVVAAHLRRHSVDAVAVEPARAAATVAAARGVPTICGTLEDASLPDASVEAAGAFDVFEHLADPGDLLTELRRVLEPGGRVAVTVPAMPKLWSAADDLAGHHRRYRRPELVAEVEAHGFRASSCRYAFASIVPSVALLRALPYRLGRRRSAARESEVGTRQVAGYGRLGRAAAGAAFEAERVLRLVADLPVGTSLVAVFRRSA